MGRPVGEWEGASASAALRPPPPPPFLPPFAYSRPASPAHRVRWHKPKRQLHARDARAVLRRGKAGGARAARAGADDDEVKVVVGHVGLRSRHSARVAQGVSQVSGVGGGGERE